MTQVNIMVTLWTCLCIRHFSLIAECQFQNGLAENNGRVIGCGVRHDKNLSGLGDMFEEFSISLNGQRRNFLPHECLGGCSPFSIVFSTKTPLLHLFKPFGCHATILKPEVALLKNMQPRCLTGIYIGTALPRGPQSTRSLFKNRFNSQDWRPRLWQAHGWCT